MSIKYKVIRLGLCLMLVSLLALPGSQALGQSGEASSLQQALILLEAGKYTEAEPLLLLATEQTPDLAEAWAYLGFCKLKLEQFLEAEQAAAKAVTLDPKLEFAQHTLVTAIYKQGDWERAGDTARAALGQLPGSTELLRAMADGYISALKPAEAREALKQLLRKDANNPYYLVNLALTYELQNDHESARSVAEKAVKANPKDFYCWQMLATVAYNQKDWQRTIEAVDQCEAIDARGAGVLLKAEALLALGKRPEGLAMFERWVGMLEGPNSVPWRLRLGKEYLNDKQYAKAIATLEPAQELALDDLQLVYALGVAYFAGEQFEKSEAAFRHFLELESTNSDVRSLRAMTLRYLDRKAESAEEYLKAVEGATPEDAAEYQLWAARLFMELKQPERAEPLLEALAASVAGEGEAFDLLIACYAAQGKQEKVAALGSSVKASGTSALVVGEALLASGQVEEALVKFQEAAQANPKDAAAHNDVGVAYMRLGDWEHALGAFERAWELDSACTLYLQNLTAAALAAGKNERALQTGTKLSRTAPDSFEAGLLFGRALLAAGQLDKASAQLEGLLAKRPADLQTALALAEVRKKQNNPAGQAEILAKAVELAPKSAALKSALGLAFLEAKQAVKAVPVLEEALVLNPSDNTARRNLAAAYQAMGEPTKAIATLKTVLAAAPDPELLLAYVGLLQQQGRQQEAVQELSAASAANPDNLALTKTLIGAQLLAGLFGQALVELDKARNNHPEDPELLALKGQAHYSLRDYSLAEVSYLAALAKSPNQADWQADLGLVYLGSGKFNEAILHLKKAVEFAPDDAMAINNLGVAYEQAGDRTQAVANYQKALQVNPGCQEAQRNLARLTSA